MSKVYVVFGYLDFGFDGCGEPEVLGVYLTPPTDKDKEQLAASRGLYRVPYVVTVEEVEVKDSYP